MAYDGLGRAVSSTDSTARTTSTAYTPATGLPTTVTTTNPKGWTTTTAFDAIRGNKSSSTDENGNVTSYQYDASGRVTGVWDPMRPQALNPAPTQATAYTISQTAPSSIMHTNINGNSEAMISYDIYDGLGRVRQTQKPSPGGGTIATDTFYNTTGAKRLVNNDYYYAANPGSTLMIPTVAVPSSDQYDYDGAGRLATATALANDNQVLWATNISYTGADTTTTTGPGNESAASTIVNTEGNIVSRLIYHGTTPTGTPDTTSYSYDALGRMATMKDTAGNQWSWTLDAAGRQISATDPDTGTVSTSYDPSGRVGTTTDAAGTLTSYSYDTLDRAVSTSVTPQGGTAHTLATSTFDGEKKGQLSTATRYNGPNYDQPVTTAVSGYNPAYLPKTTTVTLPAGLTGYAGNYTTTRGYTKTGNVRTEASPAIGGLAAETVYSYYDSFENPSALTDAGSDVLAGSTQYSHLNQIATYQQFDPNAGSTTADTTGTNQIYFNWDATTGRLANQSASNLAKGVTADLGTTNYSYTPSGKLSARELSYPSRPGAPDDYQCYTYDYANRLAAVWTAAAKNCNTAPTPDSTSVTGLGGPAPYAQTYTYTPAGDRSTVKRFDATGNLATTENYTYPAAGQPGPHRLQSLTSTPATGAPTTNSFTWDAAGRMTGRAGETLTYTPDGKLATTTGTSTLPVNPNPSAAAGTPPAPVAGTAGSIGTRYYDAGGNLVGITDGTGTTVTIGPVTAHSTPAGVQTATKTYTFAGKTVAQRTAAAGAVKLAFILSDGVDTAQTIVQPSSVTTPVTAQTRYTDPMGLARGPAQTAAGSGTYTTAPAATTGVGSNAANPAGYGAPNGYIGGLADTISTLTHLGARDLDPVTGAFTSPDPILKRNEAKNFSPYVYGEADAINNSDPSGLMIMKPQVTDDSSSWHGADANVGVAAPYIPAGPWAPGYYTPPAYTPPSFFQRMLAPSRDRPRTAPASPVSSTEASGSKKGLWSLEETIDAMNGGPPREGASRWDNIAALAGVFFPGGAGKGIGAVGEASLLNGVGRTYPKVVDPRTGEAILFPGSGLSKVPVSQRVPWGAKERGAYIRNWYDRGFATPEGGWAKYDIHHIQPREYGGTNNFDNLVPVLRDVHQQQFNPWWSGYGG
ncbi:hypothetical protein FCN77_13090 [Arthrobacter sp. 24S4-2]|uniref:RHS repeat-associated core domain-containing protein n=1 Tax=Arthrobacter sp. 24S4-2 TaxID=2575374 RepID=UPI0010C7784A|nr:RHS repeat-associated core domain-containing protein [Arthrobacter sp. 24S4-2]QCO98454.1 hypothetical protein FCN77_13090 [Arthrobacter sp. 24S4-2]